MRNVFANWPVVAHIKKTRQQTKTSHLAQPNPENVVTTLEYNRLTAYSGLLDHENPIFLR
jgi:hypothetical protein